MKHLVNYCSIPFYEEQLQNKNLHQLINEANLNGIEQYIYSTTTDELRYVDLTVGIHLRYFSYWLDYYLQQDSPYAHPEKNPQLKEYYWNTTTPEQWLDKYKLHFQHSLKYNPEYLVYHVAEANDQEIFTFQFKYSNKTILKYTAEVVNELTKNLDSHPILLFENLWWPGLKLTDPKNVDYFFSLIDYPNVGIMLDTGHLLNTNLKLRSEEEGISYLLESIKNLGSLSTLIKGLHLSCSLSAAYMAKHNYLVPEPLTGEKIWQHVTSIDQHRPFTSTKINQLINYINPEYITHELSYNSIAEMALLASKQRALIT